ncbi:MAG: hypothetical protein KGJ72_04745 [Gammaproteobacteria bacterium]|nr:hypothetical protein [Gammaproteobacteria bacterium]
MAARSIASLTIAFGLVAMPVKLYSATVSSERLRFHLLHAKDGSRLKQQYVCLEEQKVVHREEIVKGYEFAKDRYVMFDPQELQALEEAGTHSIDVSKFVPLAAVDPVYFERTCYLAPDQGGAKPFTLFVTALRESAKVRDAELKLARQLIEQQSAETFDPTAFPDEVKARVEEAIQRKVQNRPFLTIAGSRRSASVRQGVCVLIFPRNPKGLPGREVGSGLEPVPVRAGSGQPDRYGGRGIPHPFGPAPTLLWHLHCGISLNCEPIGTRIAPSGL